MKLIACLLLALLLVFQYEVIFDGQSGFTALHKLNNKIKYQRQINAKLQARQLALQANVRALRTGSRAMETHARYDLGMIKPDEIYYQFIDSIVMPGSVDGSSGIKSR